MTKNAIASDYIFFLRLLLCNWYTKNLIFERIFNFIISFIIFFNIDKWTQVLIASSLYISRSSTGKYVSYTEPVLLKDR